MNFKKSVVPIIGMLVFSCFLISIPCSSEIKLQTPEGSGTYVPEGIIALWSGPLNEIPEGWVLCDGTQNTPNMTDRFVVSTNGTEEAGTTGGAETHNHNYTDVPLHDHGALTSEGCYSNHYHTYDLPTDSVSNAVEGDVQPALLYNEIQSTGGDSGLVHSHALDTEGVPIGYTTEENHIPPYVKLAFIKKVSNQGTIPVGIILIWSEMLGELPQGWILCNGSNYTPDLRDRYIMGETVLEPGTSGGNTSHYHNYTQIPSHSHSTTSDGANHNHDAYCKSTLLAWGTTNVGYPTIEFSGYDTPSFGHNHGCYPTGQSVCSTEEENNEPPYITVDFVMNSQNCEGIPESCISLWDGSVSNIPYGWGKCDGTSETFDLREKFLKGSSLLEPIGTTGGFKTHTHAYTEVPYHDHTTSSVSSLHRHQLYEINAIHGVSTFLGTLTVYGTNIQSHQTTSVGPASHTHDTLLTGVSNPETGSERNLPPYIELMFIQQLSPVSSIGWLSPNTDEYILFPRDSTVQFDFEYSWMGLGNDITLSLTNGTVTHDAGSVLGLNHVDIPYIHGDVDATFHLMQDATELTTATRSFTFDNNRVPTVFIIDPNGGESISGSYMITWSGSDPDEDTIHYTLYYKLGDSGWAELVTDTTGTSYLWDTTAIPDSVSVNLKVDAVDGHGGFTSDETDAEFSILNENERVIPGFEVVTLFVVLMVFTVLFGRKIRKK